MVTDTFAVRIPEPIYQEMIVHVQEGYPNEACGALGSKGDLVVKHYPTANAAEQPDDFSIISPPDLVRIYKDIESNDWDMIYYHSHPVSEAYPSPRDVEYAKYGGYLYIIFSLQYRPEIPYARVFKIAPDGSITEGKIVVV